MSFVAAQGDDRKIDEDRKVPPRTPPQRLSRLNEFITEWITANVATHLPADKMAARQTARIGRFTKWAGTMLASFNRVNASGDKRCGYYNGVQSATNKHGGPDDSPNLRPNGKARRPIGSRRRRSESDDYEGEDGSLLRYDKQNPIRGLKQITTGYRKWAERYINECFNQRRNQALVKKFKNQNEVLKRLYQKTLPSL